MYEHPQYLTPGGYRRGGAKRKPAGKRKASVQTQTDGTVSPRSQKLQVRGRGTQRGISAEAAKLIAETIKIMLRQ